MTTQPSNRSRFGRWRWWLLAAVILAAVGLAVGSRWTPEIQRLLASASAAPAAAHDHDHDDGDDHDHDAKPSEHADDDHDHDTKPAAGHADDDHDHDAEGPGHADADHDHEAEHAHAKKKYNHLHDDAAALTLSQQARGNIGLRTARVELRPFERTLTVPGMVVERPGWSTLEVTAPMTGVVTRIYPIQGEAVQSGQPLFEVRLTHEDLLQAQTEFLKTVEELDVVRREVERLEKVAADGAIAGKTLLERKYEQQKQEAALRAQRQALLLHGISSEQVDKIVSSRTLLQSLTIVAPQHDEKAAKPVLMQIQELKVSQGTHVTAGTVLCRLVDHAQLYVEGKAFEQDVGPVSQAAANGWRVSATLEARSGADHSVPGLPILYLDDKVDADSRAFHFYVTLPNRLLREDKSPDGRRFIYWQFKPGQRTQLKIPVERWTDRIVLPVAAVAQDGAECYVFQANDDHFDRRPVHVEYRDQDWVVIANDGSLKPGDTVAESAAHQMQLALKNKAGGGVDPHAGHNH